MASEGRKANTSIVRLVVNPMIGLAVVFALFSLGGVTVQNLFFGSALAGIVLGLASQTVLSNVFAGLVIVIVGPFRVNERISIISSSYGAIWPTYPHELMYPTYTGVVQDIGLFYTVLVLDNARTARIPNSVVLTSLVVGLYPGHLRSQRVRMTFPLSLGVPAVESALTEATRTIAASGPGIPPPRLEVADISPTTWDGVYVLWTMDGNEDRVRDTVLRAVLPHVGSPPSTKQG
ncbi:MAG: mechanosensitive ion channel family protein, partial [Thermoplasmata archaeon]|nr:mechanosensitive ion channel family protein [Thermoplasmata archaeon]